mmetsp:Transcript_18143/g.28109  ORF Transcript_18143/g.28109 Transcript_18143/m.28109 type:complete len:493 (+) Transcript_18143:150-1628(+)
MCDSLTLAPSIPQPQAEQHSALLAESPPAWAPQPSSLQPLASHLQPSAPDSAATQPSATSATSAAACQDTNPEANRKPKKPRVRKVVPKEPVIDERDRKAAVEIIEHMSTRILLSNSPRHRGPFQPMKHQVRMMAFFGSIDGENVRFFGLQSYCRVSGVEDKTYDLWKRTAVREMTREWTLKHRDANLYSLEIVSPFPVPVNHHIKDLPGDPVPNTTVKEIGRRIDELGDEDARCLLRKLQQRFPNDSSNRNVTDRRDEPAKRAPPSSLLVDMGESQTTQNSSHTQPQTAGAAQVIPLEHSPSELPKKRSAEEISPLEEISLSGPADRLRLERENVVREKGKCEHNKFLFQECRMCFLKVPCEHGMVRRDCKECVCPHNRFKIWCRRCGGSRYNFCFHGKKSEFCKECDGRGLCVHGRPKAECIPCGGSNVCEHGRKRVFCRECGGGALCVHGRVKAKCKECGGASFCRHGKYKSKCRECGGGSICMHNKIR